MKIKFRHILACLFLLIEPFSVTAEDNCKSIVPDQRMQTLFDEILGQDSQEVAARYIAELKSLSSDGGADIVPQLFLYQLHNRQDERKVLGALGILSDLWNDINTESLVSVLSPCLESENIWLHKRAINVLDEAFYNKEKHTYDFSAIEPMLLKQQGNTPKGIVEYMYNTSPSTAFLAFANTMEENPQSRDELIALARPIFQLMEDRKSSYSRNQPIDKILVSNLDQLSKDSSWWVRVFVVQAVAQNQGFQNPEIINRLEADNCPLVREKIIWLKEQPQQYKEQTNAEEGL